MGMYNKFNELYGVKRFVMDHNHAVGTATLIKDELEEFLQEFYPNAQVYFTLGNDAVECPNQRNIAKEMTDIRYITGQQEAAAGYDVEGMDSTVHCSNMSKGIPDYLGRAFAEDQLKIAKGKYPDAELTHVGNYYIMRDTKTGKVIKPTTYHKAVIGYDLINKK